MVFNKSDRSIYQPVANKGNLPYNLTLNDNFKTVKKKLGEERLINGYGRYEQIYLWDLKNDLKLAIYLRLTRAEKTPSTLNTCHFIKATSLIEQKAGLRQKNN